ncbi:MAG: hypothetical protein FWD11_03380 [Micrococcales bacterium]|nr:hypothetical protein [Micrococcales bacterium]
MPSGSVVVMAVVNTAVIVAVLVATTPARVARFVVDGGAARFRWGTAALAVGLVNALMRFVGVDISLRGGEPDAGLAEMGFFLSAAVGFSVVVVAGLVVVLSVWPPQRPGDPKL